MRAQPVHLLVTLTFLLAPPCGVYVRWMNFGGSVEASATPRKQPMPMASHSAFSSTRSFMRSGATAAMCAAASAMWVGVQMLGGASTRYLRGCEQLIVTRD